MSFPSRHLLPLLETFASSDIFATSSRSFDFDNGGFVGWKKNWLKAKEQKQKHVESWDISTIVYGWLWYLITGSWRFLTSGLVSIQSSGLVSIQRGKGDFCCNVFRRLLLLLSCGLKMKNSKSCLCLSCGTLGRSKGWKGVHLFTKPEVKHVSEGLHWKLLSAARVQKSGFVFFRNVSVQRLIGLWQLPVVKRGFFYRKIANILLNHLGGLNSSEIGTGVFCWAPPAAACLRVWSLLLVFFLLPKVEMFRYILESTVSAVQSRYRVFFSSSIGTPPKSSKYKQVNLG